MTLAEGVGFVYVCVSVCVYVVCVSCVCFLSVACVRVFVRVRACVLSPCPLARVYVVCLFCVSVSYVRVRLCVRVRACVLSVCACVMFVCLLYVPLEYCVCVCVCVCMYTEQDVPVVLLVTSRMSS
jgi:hypothetical protein